MVGSRVGCGVHRSTPLASCRDSGASSPHARLPLPRHRSHWDLRAKVWPMYPSSRVSHPHPARNDPQDSRKQRQRGSGMSRMSTLGPALLEALEPLSAPPACSGQPLAHTFIGHASDGGDLKEKAEQRASMWGSQGDHGAQLTEDQPPVPARRRNDSVAPLLWACFPSCYMNHCTDSM